MNNGSDLKYISNPVFNNPLNLADITNNGVVAQQHELKIITTNMKMLPNAINIYQYLNTGDSLTIDGKLRKFNEFAHKNNFDKADVIVFQEMFDDAARQNIFDQLKQLGFVNFTDPPQSNPDNSNFSGLLTQLGQSTSVIQDGGVVIASKYPFKMAETEVFNASALGSDAYAEKGFAHVAVDVDGQRYHIIGTHLQSTEEEQYNNNPYAEIRKQQMQQIITKIKEIKDNPLYDGEHIIVSGDLNIKRNSDEYKQLMAIADNDNYGYNIGGNGYSPMFHDGSYTADSLPATLPADGSILDHSLFIPNFKQAGTPEIYGLANQIPVLFQESDDLTGLATSGYAAAGSPQSLASSTLGLFNIDIGSNQVSADSNGVDAYTDHRPVRNEFKIINSTSHEFIRLDNASDFYQQAGSKAKYVFTYDNQSPGMVANHVVFSNGNNIADLGSGADWVIDGRNDDISLGGDGNDNIFMFWGNNKANGGNGEDNFWLYAGANNYGNVQIIEDFMIGVDKLKIYNKDGGELYYRQQLNQNQRYDTIIAKKYADNMQSQDLVKLLDVYSFDLNTNAEIVTTLPSQFSYMMNQAGRGDADIIV